MSLKSMIDEMEIYMGSAKNYVLELEEGKKKASSAKARSELLKIKSLAHMARKGCILSQKNIPVKSRVKVTPVEPDTAVEVPKVAVPMTSKES